MHYDVFNGDADGIFSIHQLRLAAPVSDARLITGVKRDISLLNHIDTVRSSTIFVLDISLDKNRKALINLLNLGNRISYFDHHYAGDIPASPQLEYHIEPSAHTCTSLIINDLLEGRYSTWAACGAFGDNLDEQAEEVARSAGATVEEIVMLKEMGELFNYNGYGSKIEDLHFHPADLYRALQPHIDPIAFYRSTDYVERLKEGYELDIAKASEQRNIAPEGVNRIYRLPAAPWSRRIAGVFSNQKAREKAESAHAVIVDNDDGSLQISVRAPLTKKENADTLCRKFPTGGGRAAAAGINKLPPEMLDRFISAFQEIFNQN